MRNGRFWVIFLLALVASILIGVRGVMPWLRNQKLEVGSKNSDNLQVLLVGDVRVLIEVAETTEEIMLGLSGRDQLGRDEGMLFVFRERQTPTFWMKDMNFSLDFIWIDESRVVDITTKVAAPFPGKEDTQLPLYRPQVPVTEVLEVNAGWVERNGIVVGDEVRLD